MSVWERENVKFLETKEKDVKMGWMNGIPWVDCHTLEALTIVGEQEVWQNRRNYPGSSAQAITIKATSAQTHFKRNNSWSVG